MLLAPFGQLPSWQRREAASNLPRQSEEREKSKLLSSPLHLQGPWRLYPPRALCRPPISVRSWVCWVLYLPSNEATALSDPELWGLAQERQDSTALARSETFRATIDGLCEGFAQRLNERNLFGLKLAWSCEFFFGGSTGNNVAAAQPGGEFNDLDLLLVMTPTATASNTKVSVGLQRGSGSKFNNCCLEVTWFGALTRRVLNDTALGDVWAAFRLAVTEFINHHGFVEKDIALKDDGTARQMRCSFTINDIPIDVLPALKTSHGIHLILRRKVDVDGSNIVRSFGIMTARKIGGLHPKASWMICVLKHIAKIVRRIDAPGCLFEAVVLEIFGRNGWIKGYDDESIRFSQAWHDCWEMIESAKSISPPGAAADEGENLFSRMGDNEHRLRDLAQAVASLKPNDLEDIVRGSPKETSRAPTALATTTSTSTSTASPIRATYIDSARGPSTTPTIICLDADQLVAAHFLHTEHSSADNWTDLVHELKHPDTKFNQVVIYADHAPIDDSAVREALQAKSCTPVEMILAFPGSIACVAGLQFAQCLHPLSLVVVFDDVDYWYLELWRSMFLSLSVLGRSVAEKIHYACYWLSWLEQGRVVLYSSRGKLSPTNVVINEARRRLNILWSPQALAVERFCEFERFFGREHLVQLSVPPRKVREQADETKALQEWIEMCQRLNCVWYYCGMLSHVRIANVRVHEPLPLTEARQKAREHLSEPSDPILVTERDSGPVNPAIKTTDQPATLHAKHLAHHERASTLTSGTVAAAVRSRIGVGKVETKPGCFWVCLTLKDEESLLNLLSKPPLWIEALRAFGFSEAFLAIGSKRYPYYFRLNPSTPLPHGETVERDPLWNRARELHEQSPSAAGTSHFASLPDKAKHLICALKHVVTVVHGLKVPGSMFESVVLEVFEQQGWIGDLDEVQSASISFIEAWRLCWRRILSWRPISAPNKSLEEDVDLLSLVDKAELTRIGETLSSIGEKSLLDECLNGTRESLSRLITSLSQASISSLSSFLSSEGSPDLSEEYHRLLEVSLWTCQKDPNQWSIDERIEALAGALIHRYLINDGSIHPATAYLRKNHRAIQGLLDQTIESDQKHQPLKTLLAVQMLLLLPDPHDQEATVDLAKHRRYLTGIVDLNINELNDRIASRSREKLTFFGVNPQARSSIYWSKIQIMRLLSI